MHLAEVVVADFVVVVDLDVVLIFAVVDGALGVVVGDFEVVEGAAGVVLAALFFLFPSTVTV